MNPPDASSISPRLPEKWGIKVAEENDTTLADIDPPHGIAYVCDDDELLLAESEEREIR
jgi:hypothetical protein